MRHSVAQETARAERKTFADDVEYYLSLSPRQLPSQYLYDELGSALFEAICRLPWYPITRTEQRLLDARARDIVACLDSDVDDIPLSTLAELGPGSGEKLMTLLDAIAARRASMRAGAAHSVPAHAGPAHGRARHAITVHLVDISASALEAASRAIEPHTDVAIVTHQATYEAGLAEIGAEISNGARSAGRTLVLFLGSNIGNFDPPGGHAFLRNIRAALSPGDALLVGADLVKSERDLLLAYDDPLGVTAAFNRNLLVRANRDLGADFDVDAFTHRAVWNRDASRIEMHLVSARRQRVRIPESRLDITFEAGETIWTESSYKYQPAEIIGMLERAGFKRWEQFLDGRGTFALTLVEAV
jgi:dimethylhistidine N-methyltransferase